MNSVLQSVRKTRESLFGREIAGLLSLSDENGEDDDDFDLF